MVENLPSPSALLFRAAKAKMWGLDKNPKQKWDSSCGGLQGQRFAFQG